jgi:predicted phosphodiesterase
VLTTRILSDLHFGHPATSLRDVEQLAPLLRGASRVVFNGDSVEARFVKEREQGRADLDLLKAFCRSAGVETTFLTGNHDPGLTDLHHLDLADGAVLVTHGDILFHGLSPWSREAVALQEAHSRFLEEAGNPQAMEPCLAVARRSALAIETLGPLAHHHARIRTLSGFIREVWPPWRPLKMIECWVKTPSLAAAFAAQHRPEAKFILLGHTHRAGVWKRQGRTIINTGSFLPCSGMLAVDLTPAAMVVRKIVQKEGGFRLGRVVARHNLG